MCCHPQAGREQARCPPALTISRWIAATNAISNVSDDAIRSLRWSRSPIFKHTLLRYGAGRLARSFVQDQPTAPGGRRSLAQATAITAKQRSAASVEHSPRNIRHRSPFDGHPQPAETSYLEYSIHSHTDLPPRPHQYYRGAGPAQQHPAAPRLRRQCYARPTQHKGAMKHH